MVVLDTLLGVGNPLAPGPRLHRFTHAGSFQAALEAIKKVCTFPRYYFSITLLVLVFTYIFLATVKINVKNNIAILTDISF